MTEDVITTDEQYSVATNARNLRVEADRSSQADILIAAGWSGSELYRVLTRLRVTPTGALLERAQQLLCIQADRWKMVDPMETSAAVIKWWISHRCPKCQGPGELEDASGAMVKCKVCKGTGETKKPCGDRGHRLIDHLTDICNGSSRAVASRLSRMRR